LGGYVVIVLYETVFGGEEVGVSCYRLNLEGYIIVFHHHLPLEVESRGVEGLRGYSEHFTGAYCVYVEGDED
jgi:hypothetical protein